MSPVRSLKSMQIDSASRLHDSLCKLELVITWQTQFPPWLKLMLCCPQEFIRVGYYVNNEYMEEELRETPPEKAQIDRSVAHWVASMFPLHSSSGASADASESD